MNNNNNISITTDRVEELWTELSQAWPAIKNNPETAENIEKLWKILKASGNSHIKISKEIQSLLGNSSVTTAFSKNTSINQSNTTSGIKAAVTTTTSLSNVKQADDDIDSLLAEILGDDYKNDISHFSSQTNHEESKTASSNVSNNSGTEELDKLVASILGDDWLNEESATTSNIPSNDKQAAKTIQSDDASESSNLIFKTDHNIDNLVSSIIADDSYGKEVKPTFDDIKVENQKLINDKQNIDKLLDNILNEDDSEKEIIANSKSNLDDIFSLNINTAAKPSSNNNNGDFINDVASKDTGVDSTTSSLSNITNKEPIQTNSSQPAEDIDTLIDDIINRSSNSESTVSNLSNIAKDQQSITTESKADENIDDLINDIINKDTDSESVTSDTSNIANEELIETTDLTPKEDIDALINDIINKDTDSESVTSDTSNITNENPIETTNLEPEEDIDDLINDIISKDTDSESVTSGLSNITNENPIETTDSKPVENIDDLINDILNDKTESKTTEESAFSEENTADTSKNSSFQPIDTHRTRKVTPAPVINTAESSNSYKQTEKQSSNSLIIIILIILLLGCIGVWLLFFNNEESTQEIILQETYTNTTVVEDSPAVEEISTPEKTKPEDTTNTYQYEPEVEYIPSTTESATSYIEPDSSVTSYYAPAETTNVDDITITLNTPETAIAANDSTIFNESENVTIVEITPLVDDNINAIEKIVETTAPTETLGANELILNESKVEKAKIEKVIKEDPMKAVAKRKVITHVIVKGDTLWAIAKRYVNNPYRYPELARLSKIKNPDRIYPGNKVKIIIYIK